MSEQPPVPPPSPPPQQPSNQPGPSNQPTQGNPPTQPMTTSYAAPPAGPTAASAPGYPPPTSRWQQATSTSGRRWALALSAAAVALLLVLGIGVTSLLVLRNHDQVNLLGNRQATRSLGQYGPGHNGNRQGPRANGGKNGRNAPPARPGGRVQGLRGLENLLGGTALHGDVTANVGGSVQAMLFQRGQVTAMSVTSITIKSSDGFTGTYGLNAASTSRGASPVNGAQAFVLARASDKVAITTLAMPATLGAAPSN